MSRGEATRFQKGRSGNPSGRPKARRPHVSAFDIIFDKVLTVTQDGKERELTVDEALHLQTYRDALKGKRIAVRQVLKMIEKRERALAARNPPAADLIRLTKEHDADNANEAMRILGIGDYLDRHSEESSNGRRFRLNNWAVQAAISRPGRKRLDEKQVAEIKRVTLEPEKLRWPQGKRS